MASKKSAFTLIELLVAVLIFGLVFTMTTIVVKFAAGRVESYRPKILANEVRAAVDTITQKMNNANTGVNIPGVSGKVYGFKVDGSNMLIIASANNSCSFIKKDSDTIVMAQNNCAGVPTTYQKITSSEIKVTDFSFTGSHELSGPLDTQAPYLKVIIKAEDANPQYSDNKFEYQTSYEMDYQTVKKLQQ